MKGSTVLKIRYGKDHTRKHPRKMLGTVGQLLRKFSTVPEQRYISGVRAWKQRISQQKPRQSFRSSRAGASKPCPKR